MGTDGSVDVWAQCVGCLERGNLAGNVEEDDLVVKGRQRESESSHGDDAGVSEIRVMVFVLVSGPVLDAACRSVAGRSRLKCGEGFNPKDDDDRSPPSVRSVRGADELQPSTETPLWLGCISTFGASAVPLWGVAPPPQPLGAPLRPRELPSSCAEPSTSPLFFAATPPLDLATQTPLTLYQKPTRHLLLSSFHPPCIPLTCSAMPLWRHCDFIPSTAARNHTLRQDLPPGHRANASESHGDSITVLCLNQANRPQSSSPASPFLNPFAFGALKAPLGRCQ